MSSGRVLLPPMTDEEREEINQFMARTGSDSEGLYIVLAALSGIAFMMAAAILTYLLHFIFTTFYRIVVEQQCSCRARSNAENNEESSPSIVVRIDKPLDLRPPSYYQVTQQDLPSYEDLMQNKNNVQKTEDGK